MMKKLLCGILIFNLCGCQSTSTQTLPTVNKDVPYTFNQTDFYKEVADPIILKDVDQTTFITQGGTYLLQGEWQHGIHILADASETVNLVLNQVTWQCSQPAIEVESAKRVHISLPEETTTLITQTAGQKAVIVSQAPLVFNGEGTLRIEADQQGGIQAEDELIFISGNYQIHTNKTAISAQKCIAVSEGNLQLSAKEGTVMQVTHPDQRGLIYLQAGKLSLFGTQDGLSCAGMIVIQDGHYQIETNSTDPNFGRGINASQEIRLNGGEYTLSTSQDAIHCERSLLIQDGHFSIDAQGHGLSSGQELTIHSLSLELTAKKNGLDAQKIMINDGSIHIQAGNLAMNAEEQIVVNGGFLNVYSQRTDPLTDVQTDLIINKGSLLAIGHQDAMTLPSDLSQPAIIWSCTDTTQGTIALLNENEEILAYGNPAGEYDLIIISSSKIQEETTYTLSYGKETKTLVG